MTAALVAIAIGLPALLFWAVADQLGFGARQTRTSATVPFALPGGAAAGPGASASAPGGAVASGTAAPRTLGGDGGPLLHASPITVSAPGFWSWALLDLGSGAITGSTTLDRPSDTASMIKAWLAADHLSRAAPAPTRARLRQISVMIRDSDNNAAENLYRSLGGNASIKRLFGTCGLTDSKPGPGWSYTMLSARDAARMGACIADGRAAGPRWTGWLLEEMRQVRGPGRYGVVEALPAAAANGIAIKNGWLLRRDGQWHVNCLAIGHGWVLSVMQRYPARLGVAHGWAVCRSVTQQLLR